MFTFFLMKDLLSLWRGHDAKGQLRPEKIILFEVKILIILKTTKKKIYFHLLLIIILIYYDVS